MPGLLNQRHLGTPQKRATAPALWSWPSTTQRPITVAHRAGKLPRLKNGSARGGWSPVNTRNHTFTGTPVFKARQLAGAVRDSDGALVVGVVEGQDLKVRAELAPSPAFAGVQVRAGSCGGPDRHSGDLQGRKTILHGVVDTEGAYSHRGQPRGGF